MLGCSCIPSISGLFKWRQFEPEVILLAVGWYLRFSLSYRRGRVARGAGLARRSRHGVAMGSALRPGSQSAFPYETYIRVKGKWRYLYRVVSGLHRRRPSTSLSSAKQEPPPAESKALPEPKPWVNRTIPRRVSLSHRWACGLPARDLSAQE